MMDTLLRARWLWCLGLLTWAAVLWSLSATVPPPVGPSFPMKDKVMHCAYFAGGAFCLLLAWPGVSAVRSRPLWQNVVQGALFTAFIGALDEYHQTFTPGRSGNDPWDWLADTCGGLLAAWLLHRFLQRKP